MENLTHEKASKQAFKMVNKRLNEFADLEHTKMLKEVLLPKLISFTEKIDFFVNQNDEVK